MYSFQPKTKFRRDIRLLKKRGYNFTLLETAYELLAKNGALPEEYIPHPLKGKYMGCIDGHIQPDWVLIYEVITDENIIVLHRTGRHQDVFSGY